MDLTSEVLRLMSNGIGFSFLERLKQLILIGWNRISSWLEMLVIFGIGWYRMLCNHCYFIQNIVFPHCIVTSD